jgi:hypothetical protein
MKPLKPSLLKFLGFNSQGDIGPFTMYTAKDKGLVWFVKSPPLKPASYLQVVQRDKWRLAARLWRSYTAAQRGSWMLAATRANLWIHGYNLFIYVATKPDRSILNVIERDSGITLPLT